MNFNSKKIKDTSLFDNLNIIERILVMIKKNGIKNVIFALFVFMMFIFTAIVFFNQKAIVTKVVEEQKIEEQKKDVDRMEFRVKVVNPRVESILFELIAKTKCDRAFVFEMHNGTNNPSGLPFVFGNMAYEKTISDTIPSIFNQYEKVNLSLYPMSTYICLNKYFIGSIYDVKKIDSDLARKLIYNDAYYLFLYTIRGSNTTLGMIGISYRKEAPENIDAVRGSMLDASQRLSILLDINSNIESK